MKKQKTDVFGTLFRRRLLLLLVCLLFLYVVLPQIGSFSDSVDILKKVDVPLVFAACLGIFLTYILSTIMYILLATKRLNDLATFWVQVANGFASRLLPAGLGGLTLNAQYLRKQKHTLGQAVAVVSMNNILGFVGHVLLMLVGLFASGQITVRRLEVPHLGVLASVFLGLILLGIVGVLLMPSLRKRLVLVIKDVFGTWLAYHKRPKCIISALVVSLGITAAYALVLFFCSLALGVNLSFWEIYEVFTFTVLASVVVPTPGGLGGAEAGIAVGLISYSVPTPQAVAVTLLFRLLTYWLPMIPGFIAFLAIRKKYL